MFDKLKPYIPLAIKSIAVVLALWIATSFYMWISSPMVATITGTGEVDEPAAYATISFTVSGVSANPNDAVSAAKAKTLSVRALFSRQGITSDNISESQAQVVPSSAGGYQAVIAMIVKTDQAAYTQNLIPLLYANGASLVSQPVLSVSDQTQADQQAFTAAMADAQSQLKTVQQATGKTFARVIGITQTDSQTTGTLTSNATASTTSGVMKVQKTLTVTYKLW